MNNKKGISLIVLVITILVMIILAGVVIVSLQNDNPINKAKYAKMVDSAQSVRSALSQFAVTSQANTTDQGTDAVIDGILRDINTEEASGEATDGEYTKVLKDADKTGTVNGKTLSVKSFLGVDPTPLQGTQGYFLVNPKTGASIYKLKVTTFDTEINSSKPDGIVANNPA